MQLDIPDPLIKSVVKLGVSKLLAKIALKAPLIGTGPIGWVAAFAAEKMLFNVIKNGLMKINLNDQLTKAEKTDDSQITDKTIDANLDLIRATK